MELNAINQLFPQALRSPIGNPGALRIADVIDVDTLASDEQRSGLYFAARGMAIELSLAVGVVLGTVLPADFGYHPPAALTLPDLQARLMVICGCAPALMMAAGAMFMLRFPIMRKNMQKYALPWRPVPGTAGQPPSGREYKSRPGKNRLLRPGFGGWDRSSIFVLQGTICLIWLPRRSNITCPQSDFVCFPYWCSFRSPTRHRRRSKEQSQFP